MAYRLVGRVECRLYHAVHRDVRHVRGRGLCCSRLGARDGREEGAGADDFCELRVLISRSEMLLHPLTSPPP